MIAAFMLCMKGPEEAVNTYICNSGITLKYGAELFEDRLHLAGNYQSVQYESYDSWNRGLDESYELGKENAIVREFVEQLNRAEFIPRSAVVPAEEGAHIVDMEIYHMYFHMKDGTTVHLRLLENGYVRFQI